MVFIQNADADNANPPEPVPEGTYAAEVVAAIEKQTPAGDGMWRVGLRIAGGPHEGAVIYDNLVFSERGVPKALAMLKAAGLTVTGGRKYHPSEIIGRKCQVATYMKEVKDGKGFTRSFNEVPFNGYGPPIEISGGRRDEPVR